MIRFDAGLLAPATGSSEWLASRSRGPLPRGAVVMHIPSFAFQAPGGGENQLVQTGRALESLGTSIRLFSPWTDKLEHSRLLHLFGMSREGLELARIARSRGVPVVLSPICWFEPRAIWALEPDAARKAAGLARWGLRRLAPNIGSWRKELLDLADAVLPNSRAEADQLTKLFAVDPEKIRVVPNGVSPHFGHAGPELFRCLHGDGDFVLSVGRIEPRKNTLGLIRATRALGLSVCVIGEAPARFESYAAQCRQAGGGRAIWLGHRDHHDPLLASAYAAARVFALPSWFETPGLAALEAAIAGCPVVITPYGSTREYFGDLASYARPHREEEIARSIWDCWQHGREGVPPDFGESGSGTVPILHAGRPRDHVQADRGKWDCPPSASRPPKSGGTAGRNSRLSGFVASRYLWPVVAQRTAEIYDEVTD